MRRTRRLPQEQLEPHLLDVSEPRPGQQQTTAPARLLWSQVFGNTHPVQIEVGFGKGLFLVRAGQAHPQANFLGIEIERKYTLFTATRLAKRALANVKLACCDARWFLGAMVTGDSVRAIHIYFPDPWWKKRHHKRRLFTAEFVRHCARVLEPGGHLHLASDVAEYFAESVELLTAAVDLEAMPLLSSPAFEADYLTNFERKYRQQGKSIYRAVYRKRLLDRERPQKTAVVDDVH